jgi:hypothetical protein
MSLSCPHLAVISLYSADRRQTKVYPLIHLIRVDILAHIGSYPSHRGMGCTLKLPRHSFDIRPASCARFYVYNSEVCRLRLGRSLGFQLIQPRPLTEKYLEMRNHSVGAYLWLVSGVILRLTTNSLLPPP